LIRASLLPLSLVSTASHFTNLSTNGSPAEYYINIEIDHTSLDADDARLNLSSFAWYILFSNSSLGCNLEKDQPSA
jgi:hypothetical protein